MKGRIWNGMCICHTVLVNTTNGTHPISQTRWLLQKQTHINIHKVQITVITRIQKPNASVFCR